MWPLPQLKRNISCKYTFNCFKLLCFLSEVWNHASYPHQLLFSIVFSCADWHLILYSPDMFNMKFVQCTNRLMETQKVPDSTRFKSWKQHVRSAEASQRSGDAVKAACQWIWQPLWKTHTQQRKQLRLWRQITTPPRKRKKKLGKKVPDMDPSS